MAIGLSVLARIALRTDVGEAIRLLDEALAVTVGTTDVRGRFGALHVLAVAAQMSGDLERARRLMTERLELGHELGNYVAIASESANLSMVERQLGNLARAEELAVTALVIVERMGNELMVPWMVNSLAAVAAAQGDDLERAATLVGIADGGLERAGGEWPPDERVQHDEAVERLTAAMGRDAFEAAHAAGQAMTGREGVEFALRDMPVPSLST